MTHRIEYCMKMLSRKMNMESNRPEAGDTRPKFGLFDMLYFVIWFGVLSALAEMAFLQTRRLLGGRIVYLRCHTMWMSPVANVAVLGAVGLAALPLLLRISRLLAVQIAFVVLASMVFVNGLVIESGTLSRILFAAKVVLAVGLAVALERLMARRALSFERFVRRTTILLVLLVLILTVALIGWRQLQERRIIAGLPDAPPSAPNVLLIVWDTVRAESMSLYGYERPTTPYLRDLAKEGVLFQNAIATCSWTLPTHASLFTGRFHYETRTSEWRPLDATYPTLAEVLTRQGYVTGGFVANTNICCTELGLARGFVHYEDYVASAGELARSSPLVRFAFRGDRVRWLLGYYELLGRKPAPRITNDFLRWVGRIPSGHPFFAFLNYFDAHAPYLPPADFARRFGCTDKLDMYLLRYCYGQEPRPCLPSNTTAEEIESMRNAYDGAIAYLDYDLKRLFGELRQRGLLDRTLVILVSDHGEEFGEHSTFGHGLDLHIQSIYVPLILRLPSIVPGDVTVQKPVTLRDVPATVMDLLGLRDDGLFPGQSLGRYWLEPGSQEPESLDPVLSELSQSAWSFGAPVAKGDMKSIVTGDMHYIRNGDSTEEVYDLRHDPMERNDLIQTPRGAEAAAQARHIIEDILH
jgi:arylsulfatase A-like enzyme